MVAARVLAPPPPADVVAARLAVVRRRIDQAGRDQAGVRIVAVTKGFTADAVTVARQIGLYDIGENYADEFLGKVAQLSGPTDRSGAGRHDDASDDHDSSSRHAGRDGDSSRRAGASVGDGASETRWHYLGAVQRRRVRALAPVVSWWETISRVAEGEAVAARAPGATVLVEVNTTAAPGRNGCAPAEVPGLVVALREQGLDVRGLMTVGPPGAPEEARPSFRLTAHLAHDLGLPEVSMGMTGDLEVALSEGSTVVRVGRALFGERPHPPG